MKRLLLILSIVSVLVSCKKNETPPQVCYTCITETTTISTLKGSSGITTTNQTNDNVCGEIAKESIMSLGNTKYSASGLNTYLTTTCTKK